MHCQSDQDLIALIEHLAAGNPLRNLAMEVMLLRECFAESLALFDESSLEEGRKQAFETIQIGLKDFEQGLESLPPRP